MDGFTQAIRIILQGSADLKGFEAANAQLSTLSANLKKTGTNFDKLGLELTFLGGGMALSAGIAIKAASGFEQEMAKISAVLGEQSEQFIPRYRSQLLTLASTVPTDTCRWIGTKPGLKALIESHGFTCREIVESYADPQGLILLSGA